jgi:DNA polymerase V
MFPTLKRGLDMSGYDGGNTTGFASPAGDYLEHPIDLTEVLDLRRPSRYLVRIEGAALTGRGILSGDVLVVDTALPPAHGRLAVVMLGGTTLVGQLAFRHRAWWLESSEAEAAPLRIAGEGAEIWGTAVALVRIEV